MFNRFLHRILINKVSKKKITVAWVILILIAIFAACSPKAGSGFLKFMFDGVPEKNKKDSITTSVVLVPDPLKTNDKVVVQQDTATVYYHPPYKERACNKCHTAEAPGKTTFSQDEICYTCHTDFQKKYSFVHGPVAGGFCTECHAPHFSGNKKLLVRTGQELCLNCHTKNLIMKNEVHADIGKDNCTECHNPHGGSDRFILN